MTLIVILLVGAFLVGVKFTADVLKTRPHKCSVSNHLGVPLVGTSKPVLDDMGRQRRLGTAMTRIRTLYWSVR